MIQCNIFMQIRAQTLQHIAKNPMFEELEECTTVINQLLGFFLAYKHNVRKLTRKINKPIMHIIMCIDIKKKKKNWKYAVVIPLPGAGIS